MAVLDAAQNRIVVRIVYDGLPNAGKTTNLRQLATFFTPLRRGELYTPEERDGRTLYFDWLRVEGGLVGGYHLRCEMVTVPGQAGLRERRARMLRGVDGVVFVCDGSAEGMDDARRRLAELRTLAGSVPVVLQANKQDDPRTPAPSAIARSLGEPDLPLVAARAVEGVGVRETAVMIIRAVADRLQKTLIAHGLDALVGSVEDPQAIYEQMRAAEQAVMEPETAPPPLPDPAAAPGLVWPALRGRETLHRASAAPPLLRGDLAGQNGAAEGSGRSDVFVYQAGAWCFKTSMRRRFADLDEARAALLHLARTKLALDSMLLPDTVATIQRDGAGRHWLWTVAPWVTTLRGEMAAAVQARDHDGLAAALRAFADSVVAALALASSRRVALDVHPSNFARWGGRIVYIDDDVDHGSALPAVGHAVLRRIDEYRAFEGPVDQYIAHLAGRLAAELAPASAERAALRDSLAGAAPLSREGEAGRALLLDVLDGPVARRVG